MESESSTGSSTAVEEQPESTPGSTSKDASNTTDSSTTTLTSDEQAEAHPGSSEPVKPPQPDDEFWFEDGNLILIAGDVEFRIYRGPLIANSPVFKDMLSLPSPPPNKTEAASGATVAHCICAKNPALVHVQDSPEDLRHFLQALIPGKTPRVAPDDDSFHTISACIRLGHKYEVDYMVDRSLEYLKRCFLVCASSSYSRPSFPKPPTFEDVHCIGVVNLARWTNTDILLPPALMACCELSATELMNGFSREDGTREVLCREDIGRCFVGRAKLVEASALIALRVFDQTLSPGCARRTECKPIFLRILDELKNNKDVVCSIRWHDSVIPYIQREDRDRYLCWPCYRMLEAREEKEQQEVWNKLPELLGLTVENWVEECTKQSSKT
ncbi:hypothetical protein PYCCODRAFT_1466700 [Trametes coccinea BRFM310]|uniref:BTB domain-containing protein n=1 Tax=Trametes coccinea (strain BRFM310) TaxID=1353009 RepID=A0A1Y2IV18_TRAC3|nr:hypothetical protein PYCCODRAFT_1466700 [Trametes coccinea BRFM310]